MKSILPLLFLCIGLSVLNAQVIEIGNLSLNPANYIKGFKHSNSYKSTACGLDTVQYPLGKATGLAALNINNATSASAASQYYDAPQAITVSGLEFYAYSITQPSITILAQIYTAGPDSLPTGTPLASASVVVDSTFGGGALDVLQKVAVFANPVVLTNPYVVVISNNSANAMGLISNSYTAGDGQQEWLSGLLIGGTWLNGYDVNVGGPAFNADWLIHPLATYDLQASFTASPACISGPSTTVSFTNNSSSVISNRMYNYATFVGLESLSHTWNFGNGTGQVNVVDTSFAYPGPQEYTVSLIDTIYGWTSICFHDTTYTLSTPPVANFGQQVNSLSVALYDSASYAASQSWDFGDGNSSSSLNPNHTYATPGTYTVCYTVNNSCGSDVVCQAVSVTCSAPVSDFSATTVAFDASFTDLSTGMIAGSTYAWDFGDGNTSILASPSHTYATSGSYTVCLTVTSICGTNTTCKTVDVICDVPVADFTNTISVYDVNFTNASTTTGTATYAWDFGDGNTSILANPLHTYASTGNYLVCLRVDDLCGTDDTCYTIDIICDLPVASFTYDGSNTPDFDFTSTSVSAGFTDYTWDFGDGTTANTENASHTFATSQISYTVCLTVSNFCGQDDTCTAIDVTTGLSSFGSMGIKMYPNPSNGLLSFDFNNSKEVYTLHIINALGQVVYEENLALSFNTIDISHLNSGIYLIELSNAEGKYVDRLMLK